MTDGCTWGGSGRCTKKIGGRVGVLALEAKGVQAAGRPMQSAIKAHAAGADLQDAGGGEAAAACNCKECPPCMKCTVVFYLVRGAKSASPSSLISCDRYVQGCTKQSPG